MKLLLDTHVLLWWLEDQQRISQEALSAIRDQENPVFVSAATVWEIKIKKSIGKLTAPDDLEEVINDCRFSQLGISIRHATALRALPFHHRDPFDRMLIAQANMENMTIVTRDSDIIQYGVSHLLA
ncbi:MAG: type II toxin-antitoxin system VapC family toxin [Pirellulaceae bacterium]|nr:type II toxin-antitoxin system VapC family toxin [Pirellulaceae bacterium]